MFTSVAAFREEEVPVAIFEDFTAAFLAPLAISTQALIECVL